MANGIDIGNLSLSDDTVIGSIQIPIIKGDKGDTGEAGKIISIQIIMLSSTATAYANNIGTQTNAEIVLGIPRGANISTTTINQIGELIITLDNGTVLNVGQVVGRGISNVFMNEEGDFVVTLTDGSTIIVGNLKNEIKKIIEKYLEDYYTKIEIEELIPDKTSDLTNDSGFITKEVNNLTNYTLKTSTGSSIELSINSTTYVMTLNLKDINGNVISTGTVDLPLETMVVNATYDRTTKEIVLTLQSGATVRFSVADLVNGLVSETTFNTTVQSLQLAITNLEIDVEKIFGKEKQNVESNFVILQDTKKNYSLQITNIKSNILSQNQIPSKSVPIDVIGISGKQNLIELDQMVIKSRTFRNITCTVEENYVHIVGTFDNWFYYIISPEIYKNNHYVGNAYLVKRTNYREKIYIRNQSSIRRRISNDFRRRISIRCKTIYNT